MLGICREDVNYGGEDVKHHRADSMCVILVIDAESVSA